MRFIGQTEVAAFLYEWPAHGETLKAWVAEMKRGNWGSVAALGRNFHNVDASHLPSVVFYLASAGLRIETLVDFRVGVVMVMTIEPNAVWGNSPSTSWVEKRDY